MPSSHGHGHGQKSRMCVVDNNVPIQDAAMEKDGHRSSVTGGIRRDFSAISISTSISTPSSPIVCFSVHLS
jgi:hypothetical protein